MIERLNAEGANSQADILMTVDAGELWHAADLGLMQPVQSDVLNANIPESLRDPQGRWFGFSIRARTIVYSTERVKPEELSDYAALGSERWKGKLCLRTSKKVYNQSLVAMLIAEYGEPKTEEIVRGWVANLATEPFSNDTLLMEAIAAGQCDVGSGEHLLLRPPVARQARPAGEIVLGRSSRAGRAHQYLGRRRRRRMRRAASRRRNSSSGCRSPRRSRCSPAQNLEYPASPSIEPDPIVKAWGISSAVR